MSTPQTGGRVRLIADIGGTNARFAILQGEHGLPKQEKVLKTADYSGISAAIRHYLSQMNIPEPLEAAIAIANPVTGDVVKMTNGHWTFSVEETRRELGLARLLVLNDFTALAMALPLIPKAELEQVGTGGPAKGAPLALIGAGTGLGVSGLIPCGDAWIPIEGEGGHVTLCAANQREADIVGVIWREREHVSAERLLSGNGLENLYQALAILEKDRAEHLSAPQITQRAVAGTDKRCCEALEIFCGMLGTVSGNLAVTLGARGGLYIGGGIVPRLGSYFADSSFRARFEAKGRFQGYLAAIPTYVIRAVNPALLGAAISLGVGPVAAVGAPS